jgi:hypothetical protein
MIVSYTFNGIPDSQRCDLPKFRSLLARFYTCHNCFFNHSGAKPMYSIMLSLPRGLTPCVWLCMRQGYKVMPFSTACGTPLSNFEAGQNYQEVRPLLVRVRVLVDLVLHIKAAIL